MLDDLRKNQKIVIWLIAIIFVVGMAFMGIAEIFFPKPYVGKIYGKKVTFQEYDSYFRMFLANHRAQNPDAVLDDQTLQNLNDQAWNQLVQQRVFERQVKRYRIKVRDADVKHKFRHDPPADLKQNPSFLTNGEFDFQKYFDIIASNPDFAFSLEHYIRQLLPYELLERRIKSQVVINPDSVRIDWLSKNERATGRVIFWDWNAQPEQEVTEAEIAQHHNRNSSNYRKEAVRRYRYVNISVQPSAMDSLRVREDINDIYQQVINGADFGAMAELHSECPSSSNQGSLGYFVFGSMVPEFSAVAFASEIGDVSEPFQTQFGWHFINVTGKRTNDNGEPEVEASHILMRVEPSDATRMAVRYTAEQLFDTADKIGLERAAAELSLETIETNEFHADADFIPGIGRYPHLVKEAFSNRLGYLPEPIRMPDGTYIVAELSHRQNAHVQPIDQVSEVIRRELDREKRMELARQQALTFIAENNPDDYLEIASEQGLRIADFNDILITRAISGLGLVRPLNNAIFQTQADSWTDLITDPDRGHYKAFVSNRNTPNMEIFESNLERFTSEYRTQRENTHYSEWWQRVMKEANEEDFRFRFY
jgi:parvulin-like peptidyl-prolyl isomerase